jgi:hypothetical protein
VRHRIDGQRSDNQPIKQSRVEKQKLLRELRETLAGMKRHAAPSLCQSVQRRMAEVEAGSAPRPRLRRDRRGADPASRR